MWEGHTVVIYNQQCQWLYLGTDWAAAHCVFQVIVQSGRQPSVLQKLCQLPFQYFSHPRLIRVLFPSLISACYNNSQNKVILQQEMSCVLLATFIQVNWRPERKRPPQAFVFKLKSACVEKLQQWHRFGQSLPLIVKHKVPVVNYFFTTTSNF